MIDLVEKVADALQFNWKGNPGRRDEEEPLVRAAIAVVLRDQLEWARKLAKPNFAPISTSYLETYASENGIETGAGEMEQKKDIVERLKEAHCSPSNEDDVGHDLYWEAADEIERLRAQRDEAWANLRALSLVKVNIIREQ